MRSTSGISQKTTDSHHQNISSRTLTQKTLATFILNHAISRFLRSSKPLLFSWETQLTAQNYQLKFIDIDFTQLKQDLMAQGITAEEWISITSHALFSNITFERCRNIPDFKNSAFDYCDFNDCSMIGLINTTLTHCSFVKTNFENATIIQCKLNRINLQTCLFKNTLLHDLTCINSSIQQCTFTDSILINLHGLAIKDYQFNIVDKKTSICGTPWDEQHYQSYSAQQDKPLIVMLYAPENRSENANRLIKFLHAKGMHILLIHSDIGLSHPIFKQLKCINGIILPGGPDVPIHDATDRRMNCEIALLELAIQYEIPVCGICRGHQLIGYYFGAEIRSIPGHVTEESDKESNLILVKKKDKDTRLYTRLEKKYQTFQLQQQRKETVATKLERNDAGTFAYYSMCAHKQAIFFTGNRNKEQIKIVAKASDHIIEAMEIGGHIITYQHHHEFFLDKYPEQGKVAKALLKQYIHLVVEYYNNQQPHLNSEQNQKLSFRKND